MKLEPVAWMNDSKNIVTDRAKKSMMEQRHYGVEFAIAADTAERFDVPLYAIPAGYVLVKEEEARDAKRWQHARKNWHMKDCGDGWLYRHFDCADRYEEMTPLEREQALDATADAAIAAGEQ